MSPKTSSWAVLFVFTIHLFGFNAVKAAVYEVGPGKTLADPDAVPWESLMPGDMVKIYWRPEPYRNKWVICRQGEKDKPITVQGVPNEYGKLPIIDGRNATTRKDLNFWSEGRSVIKIGGANIPKDTTPQYIVVENLEIRSARPPYEFTGREGKAVYEKKASPIFIEKGEYITIRNCTMHDSGNGFFTSHQCKNIVLEKSYIYYNGIEGSIYEHNSYTAAQGLTFQFNRFGPLRAGCLGNNLKDRSAGLVVRHNWLEGGNRQLDLVDASDSEILRNDPAYRETWVYGNILIEREGDGNSQIVHYGGDSGKTAWYRQGTLRFYNNTVVSSRTSPTMLFRLSSGEETVDCRNNIVYVAGSGNNLAILDGRGTAKLQNCWFKTGWVPARGLLKGDLSGQETCMTGNNPGFANLTRENYRLKAGSLLLKGGAAWSKSDQVLAHEYVPHQRSRELSTKEPLFLGAFGDPE
ncbi:MAG TPA: right-handed parallel beta-helix repeat-containing protein [Verrucomicrobiae bacterium]